MISEKFKEEKEVVRRANTSKASTNFQSISGMLMTIVAIFLLVLRERVLLDPPFLLSVDKGNLSGTGLILGPSMFEEIEGALWPIYGARLGGQY
jgi:hypothetical protein